MTRPTIDKMKKIHYCRVAGTGFTKCGRIEGLVRRSGAWNDVTCGSCLRIRKQIEIANQAHRIQKEKDKV